MQREIGSIMAIEYIDYKSFLDEIVKNRKSETKIRFKGKEYKFWFEKGKYCFQQYFPKRKNIQRFSKYEVMLDEIIIEDKTIKEIFESDECEYIYKKFYNSDKESFYFLKDKDAVAYNLIMKPYLNNKSWYDDVMMEAQKKNVIERQAEIIINKNWLLYLWYMRILSIIAIATTIPGIICVFPECGYIGDYRFMISSIILFVVQILSFVLFGFFIPLLSDSSNKIRCYLQTNYFMYFFEVVFIIGTSINVGIKIGVNIGLVTFLVFLFSNVLAMMIGYKAYKIYYNKKLKEAEKIREEYARENKLKI